MWPCAWGEGGVGLSYPRDTAWAMSEENVEVVRRLVEGFQGWFDQGNRSGGFDLGLVTDDYEWVLEGGSFEGKSVWRGREEWVEFLRLWTEQFDDLSWQIERLIDAGPNQVVILMHHTGTG